MVTKNIGYAIESMGTCCSIFNVADRLENIAKAESNLGCTAHQFIMPYIRHPQLVSCPRIKHPLDDWEPISLYKPSERVAIWIHHFAESWYLQSNDLKQLSIQIRRLQTASPTLPSVGPLPPKQLRTCL